ncbi:MAG: UDP-3-O-[3-hydroxymyristoyl] N-acetylglucosamine deacetylase [Candidatus Omnitrophica bacterium]|nr:UDP-3-O-[3-hydroxymyristoyl] N-acetylglucosamine deacetylase [Candidatus Omnitrophota bacterium]
MPEKDLQKTIQKEASLEGVGLHSGEKVRVTFKSAPEGHGIQFCRVDLPGKPCVKAEVSNVLDLDKRPRRTSIGVGEVEVQTIEHVMATLAALEIDNLLIEIDGVELPGLDGSALDFLETLKTAGIQLQSQPRRTFRVREPIWVEGEDASLTIIPSEEFRISYILSYDHPLLRSQSYEIVLNGNNFAKDLAPSRTFVLKHEAELLRSQGLGRGANYGNTLVIGEDGVIDNTLRFDNEFARHKVLDLLGDLYLIGHGLKGHIIAYRSGHPLNIQLVQRLKEQESSSLFWGVLAKEHITATELNLDRIKQILPHRDPFLFLDRVIDYEAGKRAVGIKEFNSDDYYFKGHFPKRPIVPGVIILEAMAQLGGIIILGKKENLGRYAYFVAMDDVRFRKPVLPGDQLVLKVEMLRFRERSGRVHGTAYVNDKVVAEADLMFALVDA